MRLFRGVRVCALFFWFLLVGSCASADSQQFLEVGGARIPVPTEVELWRALPEFEDRATRNDYLDGRLVLRVVFQDEETIANSRPTMLSDRVKEAISGNSVAFDELSSHLGRETFVLSDFNPMGILSDSYEVYEQDGRPRGETYFSASADGLLAPPSYVFQGRFLVEEGMLQLILIYYDLDFAVAESLSDFFERRDGEYYWRSRESRGKLYEAIVGGNTSEVPQSLEMLYRAWQVILEELELP